MARLIESLAVTGSRKSDGTVNASGYVFLRSPGTTAQVLGYTSDDLSEAHTTVSGGIALDAAGKVDIWVNDPVDIVVQDSDGETVSTFLGFNKVRAEQVEVEHEGYTGALTDSAGAVTQALGGKTFLRTLLTRAFTSMGPDFQVQESAGATPVNIVDFLREVWISVTQFDADPTGITDSTEAIQSAINRVKALGGGVVYFPPGEYKHSANLALSAATGVTLVGAGSGVSIISCTSTTANAFTFSTCTSLAMRGIGITHTSASTGTAAVFASCTGVSLEDVDFGGGTFDICVNASGTGSDLFIQRCTLFGVNASATGRGLKTTYTRTSVSNTFIRSSGGAGIEFTGAASDGQVYACDFSVNGSNLVGILFNAATGSRFNIFANPSLGAQATPIDVTAQAVWPTIIQSGNNVRPVEQTFNTGTTVNPVIKLGNEIRLSATGGGAGTVTVGDPAVLPTTVPGTDLYFDFTFKNAAGGAVTWDFTGSTVYRTSAAIPTTAARTITVRFYWDPTAALLRERSRAETVT